MLELDVMPLVKEQAYDGHGRLEPSGADTDRYPVILTICR